MTGIRAATRSGQSDVFQNNNSTAVPTNLVTDQMVLASECWSNSITPTVTWPAGFTQFFDQSVSDGSGGFVFLRLAKKEITGSADSGTYNITLSGTAWNQLMAVSGQDLLTGSDPVEDNDFATGASGTSIPSVTSATVTGADLILHIVATFNAVTATAPTNYTEAIEGDVLHINYRALSGAGSETSSGGTLSASSPKVVAQIAFKPAASGATDLVIQDMLVAVTEDVPTLIPVYNLSIADLSIASTLDAVTIVKISDLAISDMLVSVAEDNLVVNTATNLVIQDVSVATSSDTPTLTRIMDLAIQKMLVATRTDAVDFTQVHNIAIHDMFLYTATDLVNFAGGSGGGPVSIADVQAEKLPVLTGQTGSVQDLLKFYYGGLSGLAPATAFSVSDHQKQYWETQTGLTNHTMADLEKAFYDAQLVPSGSLSDREYVYWTGL